MKGFGAWSEWLDEWLVMSNADCKSAIRQIKNLRYLAGSSVGIGR
ncbi:hypothetical protein [Pedosphaera parvula]|uniref:Uncharacterized protein n=1 Tax=Pedosphaera parvula (strain Ellin514) TaxID=320771 RepID=B9XMR8_PEDPL|nr:hypothetical protein [Pedosphaera parvula]EEF58843.1 hypothetical protein Cflav_PD1676 [Pedosphaera parvula Ellin514]